MSDFDLRDLLSPTHDGEILFGDDPTAMLEEAEVENGTLLESPPEDSTYRDADIQGVACVNCVHFENRQTDYDPDSVPKGVCGAWEAHVQGDGVCDRFSISEEASYDTDPAEPSFFAAELFQQGGEIEFAEDDGFIVKEILRTGEWPKTPGSNGVTNKPLKIVRDGESSAKDSIISLSELVESFDNGAYQYVTIPLSDDVKDHKNLTKLNTGFVKELFIKDELGGASKLMAKLHFTEPDVKGKVERGTYPDVSAGIYFNVERPDGKKFNSAVNHVVLTKSPFVSGLNPFGVEASDDDEHPEKIESYVSPGPDADDSNWDERLSFSWQKDAIKKALTDQLELSNDYLVDDIAPSKAIIRNEIAETSWVVPFEVTDDSVVLSVVNEWEAREEESEEESGEEDEPAATPKKPAEVALFSDDPLQQARRLREVRSRGIDNSQGGEAMGLSTKKDPLEGIDLSDEDAVREAFSNLAQETQQLRSRSRVGEVDAEIERVKKLGFAEAPGFLATYRDILLSDDEEPAMVLLSHDEDGNEIRGKKETVTGTEIAKRLIDALPTEEKDGQMVVALSAQHIASGSDDPTPEDDPDKGKSVEERTREAEIALHGKPSTPERKE